LQKFNEMLSTDPDRAVYGPPQVIAAHRHLAIETLLVTDELFRCGNKVKRGRTRN
jgi:protein pelota